MIAAAGSFSALSFIFSSPAIAAVILIEATGLVGPKLRVILVPGLLAAGVGTLVSLGLGSFTGLSTRDCTLSALSLAHFGHPTPGPAVQASRWPVWSMLLLIVSQGPRLLALPRELPRWTDVPGAVPRRRRGIVVCGAC